MQATLALREGSVQVRVFTAGAVLVIRMPRHLYCLALTGSLGQLLHALTCY